MTTEAPATLHDFGGFPRPLYRLQYPAPGHPALALEAGRLLAAAGFAVSHDAGRGRDHGAWVPLLHLLPAAAVPVFQVSMPHALDAAGALRLGRALAPLRARGVLIVGSGSLTHNLHDLRPPGADIAAYAEEFAAWVRQAVLADAVDRLVDYRRAAPHAARAHRAGKSLDQTADSAGRKLGEVADQVAARSSAMADQSGAALDDAEITARIKAAFLAEPGLRSLQISVATFQGVVTLSGSVDSPALAQRAAGLAGAVAGVKKVENYLVAQASR